MKKAKCVKCLTTGEYFNSISDAVKSAGNDIPKEALRAYLSKKGKYKAKNGMEYVITTKGYSWNRTARPIKCLNTGKTWKSLTMASKELGNSLKNSLNRFGKYTDKNGNKYVFLDTTSVKIEPEVKESSINENSALQQVAISLVEKGMYKEASEVTKVLARLSNNQ